MNENGRMTDFLFEDVESFDLATGMPIKEKHQFILWCDGAAAKVTSKVQGVVGMVCVIKNRYTVFVDHRYDMESVKAEVAAALKQMEQA